MFAVFSEKKIELGDHTVLVRTISKIVDLLLPEKVFFENVENYRYGSQSFKRRI